MKRKPPPALNNKCLPPFVVHEETFYSYLCKIWNDDDCPYMTIIYGSDEEDARNALDEIHKDFKYRKVITKDI